VNVGDGVGRGGRLVYVCYVMMGFLFCWVLNGKDSTDRVVLGWLMVDG